MPRTVTYYDTAEVIAMLDADHEREFEAPETDSKPSSIAYYTCGSGEPRKTLGGTTVMLTNHASSYRNDWRQTKGKL